MRLLLLQVSTGAVLFDCHAIAPDGVVDRTQRDRNVVQIGPCAQQGTADINGRAPSPSLNPFMSFITAFCVPPRPSSLTVSCPFQGLPIQTAPSHVKFKHSGTSNLGGATTYELTGQRDGGPCTVTIDGVPYEADGTLIRMTDKRVGPNPTPSLFWRDPAVWVSVDDVAEQLLP